MDAAVQCGDDGQPDRTAPRPCPAEAPRCMDSMGCTDSLCLPGQRSCDGPDVVVCNMAGDGFETVTSCPSGCAAGLCIDPCAPGGKDDYLGCEFIAVYLDNVGSTTSPRRPFAITVSNTSADETVEVAVLDRSETVIHESTIPPGELGLFPLPARDAGRTEIHGDAYRIVTSAPVTVHQFNPLNNEGAFSNDASLLFPRDALGTEYDVLSWPRIADRSGFVAIVAAALDGPTAVRVRPSVDVAASAGVPSMATGQWSTLTLEPGETLNMTTDIVGGDFSGTRIEADRPVAVFAGAQSSLVPLDVLYADHLEQQLFPVPAWGSHYIVPKFRPRGTEVDVFRVMAHADNTRLQTDPPIANVHGATLDAGEFLTFEETRHFEIRGFQAGTGDEAPVLVAQFMVGSNYPGIPATCPAGCGGFGNRCNTGIGDPTFVLNVPTRQFLDDYVFYVPNDYRQNHLSVVARNGTSVFLNGAQVGATPQPVGTTDWHVLHLDVPPGVQRLSATADVGLYVYGYDCDVSYGYPGGMNLDGLGN